jgi:hypothetical protein
MLREIDEDEERISDCEISGGSVVTSADQLGWM